jgi:rSAM/selenodomain-associated transferase 1
MAEPILIVFARTPRLGTVKRRLAAEIGDVPALRVARNLLAALLRRLRALRGFKRVLATTPGRARFPTPPAWSRIPQGQGDLAARMHRAFRRYPNRLVILVGSDIPGLGPAEIRAAARALHHAGAVFGPALDGGYYLVAMGARRPANPFANVRWSTQHALADTEMNFTSFRRARLRPLRDIDTAADLPARL